MEGCRVIGDNYPDVSFNDLVRTQVFTDNNDMSETKPSHNLEDQVPIYALVINQYLNLACYRTESSLTSFRQNRESLSYQNGSR